MNKSRNGFSPFRASVNRQSKTVRLNRNWNRWRSEDGSCFISEDPARDGVNWYGYCGNNPMTNTDPTGLWNSTPEDQGRYGGYGTSDNSETSAPSYTPTGEPESPVVTTPDVPESPLGYDDYGNEQNQLTDGLSTNDDIKLPQDDPEGYKGLRGIAMKLAEKLRGKNVLSFISINSDLIKTLSIQNGVDPNLVKAIIYEEQTHNKTAGILEDILPVNSVGPMAISKKYWDGLSKNEMQEVLPNISLGIEILEESQKRVLGMNPDASVAQIASNYNNVNATTITTDYGKRVESFYYWFENK